MILVGSGPQDGPTWHQNRIQNRSKIDPKGHRNQDSGWDLEPSWNDFWSILAPSWAQVGLKLAPKSGKLGSQDDVKKMTKKVECKAMQEK